jgi:sugar diacid utilization regulator
MQALVDGNKVISVTVIDTHTHIHILMNSKSSQKLKAKATVLGLDVKVPRATLGVARKKWQVTTYKTKINTVNSSPMSGLKINLFY